MERQARHILVFRASFALFLTFYYLARALAPDPGFCNTNLKMVHVGVDMRLPANQDPKPELEENEFIEVFHVRLADLWETCIKMDNLGYAIDARIANIAEGIEIAKKFKL